MSKAPDKQPVSQLQHQPQSWTAATNPARRGAAGLIAVAAIAAATTVFGPGLRHSSNDGHRGRPAILSVGGTNYTGAFVLIDADVAQNRPFALRSLQMPETERQRVAETMRSGPTRMAAVTLWDTMDEDGDIVEISAAGFSQRLVILNTPKLFFVPVMPGAPVRITAIKDGGGGGVTLGVKTVVGDVPLPFLAVGQSIEVPAL